MPSDPTGTTVATATPFGSPTGPAPAPPVGGWYFCPGDLGLATCADGTGTLIRQLAIPMGGPSDVTYNDRDGYVYYREVLSNEHGSLERISRAPLTGGAAQVVVQGPDSLNETQVSFGSPVSSPDGSFLAYGQLTLTTDVPGGPTHVPSPGAVVVNGPPNGPPGEPIFTRLSQIKIQNLHSLHIAPAIVPLSMVSGDIAAPLGWSADGRRLFFVGSGQHVDALAVGTDGVATGVSTVFDPAAVAPGCGVVQTLLSSSGDFFVVATCVNTIDVVKVHDGKPQPFGVILNTNGWQVNTAQLDTAGRVLALTWFTPPSPPQCVSVSGSARIIDGVPTAIQLDTTPGCIFHGGSGGPVPAASSP